MTGKLQTQNVFDRCHHLEFNDHVDRVDLKRFAFLTFLLYFYLAISFIFIQQMEN